MAYAKRSVMAMFWRGWGWAAVLMFVLGLLFGAAGVAQRTLAQSLDRDGVTVPGVVTGLHRSGASGDRSYAASYDFVTAAGEAVSGRQDISLRSYDRLAPGQAVEVTYLPSDPASSEIVQGRTGRSGWVFMLVSAALLGGGAVWSWTQFARARIEVALRDHGVVLRAEVLAHEVAVKSKDRPIRWTVLWRDETGAEGKTYPVRAEALPPVGATLTVYADPAGGAKAVWEGDVGSR